MKLPTLTLIACLAANAAMSKDRLIPFDKVFLKVETNDWLREGRPHLNVSVTLARSAAEPEGVTSIEVDCYEFKSHRRMMPDQDLKAFFDVCASAAQGQSMRVETMTATYKGEEKTVYEGISVGGKMMVRVSRGGQKADFAPEEGDDVKKALAEAKIGEAWFKKLLASETLPATTPTVRAPRSKGYSLISTVGEVRGGGITYALTVHSMELLKKPGHRVQAEIRFPGGSSGGEWVEEMFNKVSSALESAGKQQAYSFQSKKAEDGEYTVTANLATYEADVVLKPDSFFSDRTPKRGHFGGIEWAQIEKLKEAAEERRKWFAAHESLFFTRPPK